MARSKYNWKVINWNLPNHEIASELGCCHTQVSRARKKHAPETIGEFRSTGRKVVIDWSNADWLKSGRVLARQYKVDRMTVYANRRKFAPETIKKAGRPRKSENK